MRELNAILTIAFRDFLKLMRDRPRIFAGLVFPLLFVGILGESLSSSVGKTLPFDYLTFIFTGVFAQSMFQSSAAGVISLIQDREEDFSQELFISPVSRYSIIIGKIFGETMVSSVQGAGIIAFGLIMGVHLTLAKIVLMVPVGLIACFLGGAFGVFVMSFLSSQRTVGQVFPFILFPQIFLSGVFNPLHDLPIALAILSRIAPLTYAVDFVRHIYYLGSPSRSYVVIHSLLLDSVVIAVLFFTFLLFGTARFVKKERNR